MWLIPAISILIVILTILAYYIGVTRQDVYMGQRGIDWKLLRLDKPDFVYLGVISTMDSFVAALNVISHNWYVLIGLASIGFFPAACFVAADRLRRMKESPQKKTLKPWQKDTLFMAFAALSMPMTLFAGMAILAFTLIIPAIIGETAAKREIARERAILQAGCDQIQAYRCFELLESSKVIARGFLLTAAKGQVLLHDGAGASLWSLDKRDLVIASAQSKIAIETNIKDAVAHARAKSKTSAQ
ncbi:hypothetical protein [Cupriavidus sp. H19C3]|uniref:hypothetical protein n=1 Tax=Cupriavidus sp. H19C3 TaxID=3241603 RepID=UPI003BF8A960